MDNGRVTGPIKSVKAILSGAVKAKAPNAPKSKPMDSETVNKVKIAAGKPPIRLSGGAMTMKGC